MVAETGTSWQKTSAGRITCFIKMSREGLLVSIKKNRSFEKFHEIILMKYSISECVSLEQESCRGRSATVTCTFTQGLVLGAVVWTSAGETTHPPLQFASQVTIQALHQASV